MNSIRVEYIVNNLVPLLETTVHQTHNHPSRKSNNNPNNDNNNNNNNNNSSRRRPPPPPPPLLGLSALDVGCGGGLLSESLARLGAKVTAVDPSIQLVEQAKKHAQLDPKTQQAIEYRGGCTVEQLAEENKHAERLYDVICLLEVIEHVTDVDSILSSVKSLLKPDTGRLFVSTMNRTVKSNIVAIVGAEYVMGYLPIGTHDWNSFRSPSEVQQLMERAGMEQVDVQGMVITSPPFCGEWHWKLDRNDLDVNWIGMYKIK
jgi:ubiquinone biosynthesis O-methyltransferase